MFDTCIYIYIYIEREREITNITNASHDEIEYASVFFSFFNATMFSHN